MTGITQPKRRQLLAQIAGILAAPTLPPEIEIEVGAVPGLTGDPGSLQYGATVVVRIERPLDAITTLLQSVRALLPRGARFIVLDDGTTDFNSCQRLRWLSTAEIRARPDAMSAYAQLVAVGRA